MVWPPKLFNRAAPTCLVVAILWGGGLAACPLNPGDAVACCTASLNYLPLDRALALAPAERVPLYYDSWAAGQSYRCGVLRDMRYGEMTLGDWGLTYDGRLRLAIDGRQEDFKAWEKDNKLSQLFGKQAFVLCDERGRALSLEVLLPQSSQDVGDIWRVWCDHPQVKGGEVVTLKMRAPSGAKVVFHICGLEAHLPAVEVSPGCYEARWRSPHGDMSQVGWWGSWQRGKDSFRRWGEPCSVWASPPEIYQYGPSTPDGQIATCAPEAELFACYRSAVGMLPVGAIRLWVDGRDVSAQARRTSEVLTFMPRQGWVTGLHSAILVIGDAAGNVSEKRWQFQVQP